MIVVVWKDTDDGVSLTDLRLWDILIENGFDQAYLDRMQTAFCTLEQKGDN